MKKLKIAVVLCMLFGASFPSMQAQLPSQNGQDVPRKGIGDKPNHPRVPSHESIGFAYQNGVCYFSMPDYITYIDVTMESESGQVYSGCVYAASPLWTVSLTPGEYQISCDSDEGSHFAGTIWID